MEFACLGRDPSTAKAKRGSSIYKIVSDDGKMLAIVKSEYDNARAFRAYGKEITPKVWVVRWALLTDEYGTYGGHTEKFKNLYDIEDKYMFSNYPGPWKVLERKK